MDLDNPVEFQECVDKPTLIPIYDEDVIVDVCKFEPNLNLVGVPYYVNKSCDIGICRLTKGKYKGSLVIMYEDKIHPKQNRARFISETDAYEVCVNRGKYEVINKYDIKPEY